VATEPLTPETDLEAVESFYKDLIHELGEHARRPGATAIGAAAVAKRVARAHGLAVAERLPLPRLTRAEREDTAPLPEPGTRP
jgi:hypothetical protein